MERFFGDRSPEITDREGKHTQFARNLAGECIVLLENDGVLPLKNAERVALYGIGARHTVKGGTGSGDVYTRSTSTIEQGFQEAGIDVLTSNWLDRYDKKREKSFAEYLKLVPQIADEQKLLDIAVGLYYPPKETPPLPILPEDIKDADAAVYVISRRSGEGADRFIKKGDYFLFDEEKENLITLAKTYKNLIVLLNIGGVMDLTELKQIHGINAILLMGQLGNTGGDVVVDTLTGKITPSGKLTDTWAARYEDYPSAETFSHNNGNVADEYYTEGIYVGYRYFDTKKIAPLYCFGYGKSYTDFTMGIKGVSRLDNKIEISVEVMNTGKEYNGKEVVQVYYSAPNGSINKPTQELAAFAKTRELSPGESEVLSISFLVEDMASYCETEASWVLERGKYVLWVGTSSRNLKAAAIIENSEEVITQKLKNLFGEERFEELSVLREQVGEQGISEPVIVKIPKEAVRTYVPSYQNRRKEFSTKQHRILTASDIQSGSCTVEELVSQLEIEELATICVGTSRVGEADSNVIGGASETVPGAAGDTSAMLQDTRGIAPLIFADGPAGLRLTPHFRVSTKGEILSEDDSSKDAVDYYQYCTAIPIGWSLAQSWNEELLETAGEVVGKEMEQFHIDVWLAPAMNIHRNPLCGRNFEYYSEDPFITGKMAAAITRGVQKNAGKGAAIKHFAANNGEDNRYFQNAHVSERALREIYLKGFEIAVKESQPVSIMTSYNLINGIHAANNRDLLQAVLRDEWGYQGFVMTDWFGTQYMPALTGENHTEHPIAASSGCCFAGNDLQMPGSSKNVQDLIDAVSSGMPIDGYVVTIGDLQQCAANIIRAAIRARSEDRPTESNEDVC